MEAAFQARQEAAEERWRPERDDIQQKLDMFEGSRKTAQEASRELKDCQRASPATSISIKHGDSVCNV